MIRLKTLTLALTVILFGCTVFGFHIAQRQSVEPEKVTLCQLKSDPAKYNHKLIEVTGFVSHGFEDFTISDPNCSSWLGIWLEYGGRVASGTMYCCGVAANRTRPKQLVVEKIPISLLDDEQFREFDKLLQRRPDSVVHATIVGRFFSGEQVKYPKGTFWGGYGHMELLQSSRNSAGQVGRPTRWRGPGLRGIGRPAGHQQDRMRI